MSEEDYVSFKSIKLLKEKVMQKIMFNDKYGLTKAVLEGRKTQTRRIIKVDEDKLDDFRENYYNFTLDDLEGKDLLDAYFVNNPQKLPYRIGDIIAVAQAYHDFYNDEYNPVMFPSGAGWLNKMFVKADLMPHQIIITNVRIKHLQDISNDDCLREGVIYSDKYSLPYGIMDVKAPNGVFFYYSTPREAFAALIDKVNGKGTWNKNPYVWVYDFKLVE